MKRPHLIIIITASTLVLAALIAIALPATRRALWPQAAVPMLSNPGFEGPFSPAGGVGELTVAEHWHPFYDNNPPNHRPEFQRESSTAGSGRVHAGLAAQKLFTTFSPHDGGIYQEVHQVSPGQWYTLSAWGYQWSSAQHNPDVSTNDGKCSLLVGINPWGDTNPLARTTVWGREALQVYNDWTQIGVTAQAWSDKIVVALRQVCIWGPQHNDAYLDDAHLELASLGQPVTPAPTYTPQPTYTPYPTGTPCPVAGSCPSIDDIRRTVREQLDCTIIQLAGPTCDP